MDFQLSSLDSVPFSAVHVFSLDIPVRLIRCHTQFIVCQAQLITAQTQCLAEFPGLKELNRIKAKSYEKIGPGFRSYETRVKAGSRISNLDFTWDHKNLI